MGNGRAGEEGRPAVWEAGVMVSVGGSPSLCPSVRSQWREQSLSVSAILWAKHKHTSLSTGGLARTGVSLLAWGGLPAWCLEVARAAFAGGSLCGQRSSCRLHLWGQWGRGEVFSEHPVLPGGLWIEAHIQQMKS